LTDVPLTLTPGQLEFLCDHVEGFAPDDWNACCAGHAGSDRQFVRVAHRTEPLSYVLVVWSGADPDWPRFIGIAADFAGVGAFLPQVFAADGELGLLLVEDLGSETLHSYCRTPGRTSEEVERAYFDVIDALIRWQRVDPAMSSTLCARRLDMETFLWETSYFAKHCVGQRFGLSSLLDVRWEAERTALAREADAYETVCAHRDFQSENIMVVDRRISFVDFQGARLGPAGYDLGSLVFDPYATWIDRSLAYRLYDYYVTQTSHGMDLRTFHVCSLQRLMQALGAYGNLALNKGKERYLEFVPLALERLADVLDQTEGLDRTKEVVAACRERLARAP
jgi:aminoglycoside/choline kinase family phosphotransferase